MSKGKDSTIIRTTVDRDLYLKADMRAKERGTNLSALLRNLLIKWCEEGDVAGAPTPGEGEQAKWLRLQKWMQLNGFSRPASARTKSDVLKWAKAQGFKG